MTPQVLRFNRTDEEDSFILVHLVHNESPSLNLTLTATEGEAAYSASINDSNLNNFRSKTYKGSDEEWSQIICHILGIDQAQHQPTKNGSSSSSSSWSVGLEATANVHETAEESEIIITIRKRVQDITQKLGTIPLQNSEAEISLFDWTGITASKASSLSQDVKNLTASLTESEEKVSKLTQQLNELIQAKTAHENALIANFAQLLNEKKLKIRNQQRLLATSTADPEKVAQLQTSTKQSQESPRLKREHTETDDSDGFEPMEIDENAKSKTKTNTKTVSSDHSDDENGDGNQDHNKDQETLSEDEDEANATTDEDSGSGSEEEEGEEEKSKPPTNESQSKHAHTPAPTNAPPPRRELPFTRRSAPAKGSEPAAAPATATRSKGSVSTGEETDGETDDDEL